MTAILVKMSTKMIMMTIMMIVLLPVTMKLVEVVMTVSVMGDEYGIGGHGNGDLLVVGGDSGGIGEGCNTYRGGVGGGHVN